MTLRERHCTVALVAASVGCATACDDCQTAGSSAARPVPASRLEGHASLEPHSQPKRLVSAGGAEGAPTLLLPGARELAVAPAKGLAATL